MEYSRNISIPPGEIVTSAYSGKGSQGIPTKGCVIHANSHIAIPAICPDGKIGSPGFVKQIGRGIERSQ